MKLPIWFGCLCIAVGAFDSYATVIYSNLGPGDSFLPMNTPPGGAGAGVVVVPGPGAVDARCASSFTTGPSRWSFQSAELVLGDANGEENSFEMSVMTDAGGGPGQVLQTIPLSGVPLGPAIIPVQASDPLILEADTTYWIALAAVVQNPNHISGCTWLINNMHMGNIASNGGIVGGSWKNFGDLAPAMRINGSVIPEPGLSLGIGYAALLAITRRRHR